MNFLGKQIGLLALGFSLFFCQNSKPANYQFLSPALKISLAPFLLRVNSAESLATTSNEDYELNQSGLITARTLSSMASNWQTQKPSGITGKLVVLQIQGSSTTPSQKFVPSNESQGVYSYLVTTPSSALETSLFGQTRNNGLVDTETLVPDGRTADAFLENYGIHPGRDLIVFAMDTETSSNLWNALRGYYALRYWGVNAPNLAVLNGSVDANQSRGELLTTSARNTSVRREFVSLKTLNNDNTILQATIADVQHIVLSGNTTFEKVTPLPASTPVFLDARQPNEFKPSGLQTPAGTGKSCSSQFNSSCRVPIEGAISGAVNLPWNGSNTSFTDGFVNNGSSSANTIDLRFKTKASISELLRSQGIERNGSQVISYCRTAVRAMVPFFATNAIVGYPSRVYDGSWIEWSQFSTRTNDNDPNWTNLNSSSPWRTNRSNLTQNLYLNPAPTSIPTINIPTFQAFSRSANSIIDADKAYLRATSGSQNTTTSPSGGGATGGGGNACGS